MTMALLKVIVTTDIFCCNNSPYKRKCRKFIQIIYSLRNLKRNILLTYKQIYLYFQITRNINMYILFHIPRFISIKVVVFKHHITVYFNLSVNVTNKVTWSRYLIIYFSDPTLFGLYATFRCNIL
jgi:hypothetical protein